MAVHATQKLVEQFETVDDFNEFALAFAEWKNSGSDGEYHSYLFGKDSAYISPKVDGIPYMLRHVHLVPIKQADLLAKWNKAFKTKSRKTSDRVLVYVNDGAKNMLLIFILPEPDAHDIAKMQTAQDKAIMLGFAEVAAAFLDTGEILV
jgi:mRNA interferase YafO